MTTFALDTSALAAWVLQEAPRWRAVDALLSAQEADPVLPAPGLAELITVVQRRGNVSAPSLIASAIAARGVRMELLVESDQVRAAELLLASHTQPSTGRAVSLSLGDALVLAVVERLGVPVVTLDRYWEQFESAGHTTARVVIL